MKMALSCARYTHSVVNDFSPTNASCAIREILLFDKSIRFNRLKFAKAFGVISVIKFCSKRLQGKHKIILLKFFWWNKMFFCGRDSMTFNKKKFSKCFQTID